MFKAEAKPSGPGQTFGTASLRRGRRRSEFCLRALAKILAVRQDLEDKSFAWALGRFWDIIISTVYVTVCDIEKSS